MSEVRYTEAHYSKEAFAKYLRTLRKNHELNQEQIASVLNLDRSTYTYYEIGKTEPSLSSLDKLSHIFQVSADELLYGGVKRVFPQKTGGSLRHSFDLNKEEQTLLCFFRLLSMDGQKALLEFAQKLTKDA